MWKKLGVWKPFKILTGGLKTLKIFSEGLKTPCFLNMCSPVCVLDTSLERKNLTNLSVEVKKSLWIMWKCILSVCERFVNFWIKILYEPCYTQRERTNAVLFNEVIHKQSQIALFHAAFQTKLKFSRISEEWNIINSMMYKINRNHVSY